MSSGGSQLVFNPGTGTYMPKTPGGSSLPAVNNNNNSGSGSNSGANKPSTPSTPKNPNQPPSGSGGGGGGSNKPPGGGGGSGGGSGGSGGGSNVPPVGPNTPPGVSNIPDDNKDFPSWLPRDPTGTKVYYIIYPYQEEKGKPHRDRPPLYNPNTYFTIDPDSGVKESYGKYSSNFGGSNVPNNKEPTVKDLEEYNKYLKELSYVNKGTTFQKVNYLKYNYNPEIAQRVNAYTRSLGLGDLYDAHFKSGGRLNSEQQKLLDTAIAKTLETQGKDAVILPVRGGSVFVRPKDVNEWTGGSGGGGVGGGGGYAGSPTSTIQPPPNNQSVNWDRIIETSESNLQNLQQLKDFYTNVTGKSAENVSLNELSKFYTAYNILASNPSNSTISAIVDKDVRNYASQIYDYQIRSIERLAKQEGYDLLYSPYSMRDVRVTKIDTTVDDKALAIQQYYMRDIDEESMKRLNQNSKKPRRKGIEIKVKNEPSPNDYVGTLVPGDNVKVSFQGNQTYSSGNSVQGVSEYDTGLESNKLYSPFTPSSVSPLGLPLGLGSVPFVSPESNNTGSGLDKLVQKVPQAGPGIPVFINSAITRSDINFNVPTESPTVTNAVQTTLSTLNIETIQYYLKEKGGMLTINIPVNKFSEEELQLLALERNVDVSQLKNSKTIPITINLNTIVNPLTQETFAEYLIARQPASEKALFSYVNNPGVLETMAYGTLVNLPIMAQENAIASAFQSAISFPILVDIPYKFETFVTGKSKELATDKLTISSASDYALGLIDVGLSVTALKTAGTVAKGGKEALKMAAKDVTYYLNFPVIGTTMDLTGQYIVSNFKTVKAVGEGLTKASRYVKAVEIGAQATGWFTYTIDKTLNRELGPLSAMTESKMQSIKSVFSLSDTKVPYTEKSDILTSLTIANVPYYAARVAGVNIPSKSVVKKGLLETAYYGANMFAIGLLTQSAYEKEKGDIARTYGRASGSIGFIEFWLEGQTIDTVFEKSSIYKSAEATLEANVKKGDIIPSEYNLRVSKLKDVDLEVKQPQPEKLFLMGFKKKGDALYVAGVTYDIKGQEIKTVYKTGTVKKGEQYFKGGVRPFFFAPDIKTDTKQSREQAVTFDIKEDTKAVKLPDVKLDIKQDIRTIRLADIKQDVKVDLRNDIRTDLKTDLKTDMRLDVKTDLRPELRLDVKTDLKTDVKPDKRIRVDLKPIEIKPIDIKFDLKQDVLIKPPEETKIDIRWDYKWDTKDYKIDIPEVPPLVLFPSLFGGGGGKGRGSGVQLSERKSKYKASVGAGILDIKAPIVNIETTGLELRPLIGQYTPKRRSKRR